MVYKIPIDVIYEDEYLLAVNKPAGLVSVPAPHIPNYKTLQGQIREWAEREGKDYKPYLLNRLDQDTSGVLLLGKHPRDRDKLEAIFQDPRTEKTYLAYVKWVPKQREGTIKFSLEARSVAKKVPAVTHYKVVKMIGNSSLLEVRIETGRKHQIRKHLAMIGHPLILDREYGDKTFNNNWQRLKKGKGKFYLHSWKTSFFHPFLKQEVVVEAPAPEL